MRIDAEYAIKKDIRNNPVVREIDLEQKRDFLRSVALAALMVGMLLFSAWQQFKIVQHGRDVEGVRQELAKAREANRQLRLNLLTEQDLAVIERRAHQELQLVSPNVAEIVVLDRVPVGNPSRAIIADARQGGR